MRVGVDVCVFGCRSVCGKHVIQQASLLLLRFLVVLFCFVGVQRRRRDSFLFSREFGGCVAEAVV